MRNRDRNKRVPERVQVVVVERRLGVFEGGELFRREVGRGRAGPAQRGRQ